MRTISAPFESLSEKIQYKSIELLQRGSHLIEKVRKSKAYIAISDQRGDVPGWVLVVLMTTGLVTAIWTIAAPRLTAILKNSLDAMNGIR
jgi:hypothetical protein